MRVTKRLQQSMPCSLNLGVNVTIFTTICYYQNGICFKVIVTNNKYERKLNNFRFYLISINSSHYQDEDIITVLDVNFN
jgi:hypothetical protein